MARPNDPAPVAAPPRGPIFAALSCAVAAMSALHAIQPELDPVAEPVSFYVQGQHSWLIVVALATFGVANLMLAKHPLLGRLSVRALIGFGCGMLLTAAVPSDSWFPWEQSPSWHGLVHGAFAMLAPPLLLVPMLELSRRAPRPRWFRLLALGYFVSLAACAASLAVGFWHDRAPPLIGIAERLLALLAVIWVALAATTSNASSAVHD